MKPVLYVHILDHLNLQKKKKVIGLTRNNGVHGSDFQNWREKKPFQFVFF